MDTRFSINSVWRRADSAAPRCRDDDKSTEKKIIISVYEVAIIQMDKDDIIQKEPIVVRIADSLDYIIGHIHDEFFELDSVNFSKEEGIITIPYRRIFHGNPSRLIRNWIIYRTYEVDVIRAILTIRNVEGYEVDNRSRIGTYSFNEISYDKNLLKIVCCEDCDLLIATNKIEIESRDIEVRGKSRISHGLFFSAFSGKVRE